MKKSVYGMTNSVKLFSDELTNWLIVKEGFKQSQWGKKYKCATDGSNLVVLSYVNTCVYWYTSEEIGQWFLDKNLNIFYMNLLVYEHWFMSIRISQQKEYVISVDQDKCVTYVVATYLDTDIVKET